MSAEFFSMFDGVQQKKSIWFKRMSAIFISMFDVVQLVQLKKVHGSKGCLQHLLMMMAIPRICSKVYAKSIIGHDIEYLAF